MIHLERVAAPAVPWAEPHGRFTMLMERLIIDVATQCVTVTGVCRLLRTNWDQTWAVLERAVARGQTRKAAEPVMRHRIGTNFQAQAEGKTSEDIIAMLLKAVGEPEPPKYGAKKRLG